MKRIVAFDLSTKTGICWTKGPTFETSWMCREKEESSDEYVDRLYGHIVTWAPPLAFDVAIIEDYSFGSMGRGKTLLSEIGGVVKLALREIKVPYAVVSPTQWKSYVLGAAQAKKEDIKMLVYKKFKQDFSDKSNDECDAYCMWLLGRDLTGKHNFRKQRTKAYDELWARVHRMVYEGEVERSC